MTRQELDAMAGHDGRETLTAATIAEESLVALRVSHAFVSFVLRASCVYCPRRLEEKSLYIGMGSGHNESITFLF